MTNGPRESSASPSTSALVDKMAQQREALLLEKLELDNEEQRARIAQLQLEWWQKPKALVVMLIPVIPLLATAVASISDKLAEREKTAARLKADEADIARQKAENERQSYVIQNARLAVEKEQTTFQIEQLRQAQKDLDRDRQELETRVAALRGHERQLIDTVFNRYKRVCEIAGRIFTAPNYESAESAFAEFDQFELLGIGSTISAPILAIRATLDQWKKDGQRPDQELKTAVLNFSSACRQAFETRKTSQLEAAIRQLTAEIYREAEDMVQGLNQAADFAQAAEQVDRFWQLYYGKLILVESGQVAKAMVDAGRALGAWKADPAAPPDRHLLKKLSDTLHDELKVLLKPTENQGKDAGRMDGQK